MRFERISVAIPLIIAITASVAVVAGPRWPWRRRVNPNVETFHVTAHKNTPIELWPDEPVSPISVISEKFEQSLHTLCQTTPQRAKRYSKWIIENAAQFALDPFLIAALMYDQSNCRPVSYKRYQKRGLYSLSHFYPTMHLSSLKDDSYDYYVRNGAGWDKRTLKLSVPLNRWKAANPKNNIYLTAATLFVFKEQFATLQAEFVRSPYRHFVSNWIFGDWVRNPEPENRILAARRRLLEYYAGAPIKKVGKYGRIPLVSPMDGTPRLIIDYFQNRRGKKRGFGHRGIDIDGAIGEPVRAVADGLVVFAGMDKPGGGEHECLPPDVANALTPEQIPQGGGLYVAINHGDDFGTIYMHLNSYNVVRYQKVKAGDVIGALGQSGSKQSGPHLHLEFRQEEQRVDPAEYLDAVLVNPYKHLPRRIKRHQTSTSVVSAISGRQ